MTKLLISSFYLLKQYSFSCVMLKKSPTLISFIGYLNVLLILKNCSNSKCINFKNKGIFGKIYLTDNFFLGFFSCLLLILQLHYKNTCIWSLLKVFNIWVGEFVHSFCGYNCVYASISKINILKTKTTTKNIVHNSFQSS